MPCEVGTSKIGNSPGGRILEIWETHRRHCADPQESSTHRNPPLRKNSRSRCAFLRGKLAGAGVGHEQDWTPEEQRIGERDDDVMRVAVLVELDRHAGELREAHGKVVIGAGIVGAPAAAVERAAVHEAAVEVVGLRRPRHHPAPSAYPDLLGHRRGHRRHHDQHDRAEPPDRHATPHVGIIRRPDT